MVSDPERIVVIGAGVAGLTTARDLQAVGFDVSVVEARDRIGGRIWTEKLADGTAVDMGASWVHGYCPQNPLVALAEACQADLVSTDWQERVANFEARGTEEGPEEAREVIGDEELERVEGLMKLHWQLFKTRQADMRKAAKAHARPLGNAGASCAEDEALSRDGDIGLAEGLQDLRSKRFPGLAALGERERLLLHHLWLGETEYDVAGALGDMSFTWWDHDECFGDDDRLWVKGFAQVAEHLANGLRIRLEAPVAAVRALPGAAGMEVRLRDGEVIPCRACVCTLPLAVLQAGHVAFEPPFAGARTRALGCLGVSAMNKVVLRFGRCFWARALEGGEADAFERFATSPGRAAAKALDAGFWVNLRPVTGANVLVAYFCADAARETETRSEEDLVAACLAMLRTMFPCEEVDAAELLETRISRWVSDEYALGAYSYLRRGARPEDHDALAKAEPPLFFAGEATNRMYPATVHGAHISGRRAAKEVTEWLRPTLKKEKRGGRRA